MRPLLWKEMRELRPQVLAWAAAGAALELSLLTHVFDGSFVVLWTSLMPFAMFAAAIGLGVRQIAGERHARTLDFLLVRPVAARTVVWSKFLAGSVVLALLVTEAVALGYAVTPSIYWPGTPRIQDVRMWRLLITLFPRFWGLYALVLMFSVLVDRASKAWAMAGVLVVTLSILAASFLEVAPFSAFVYWLPFFESSGGLLQVAEDWRLFGMTGLVFAGGALLLTVASAKLLEHSSERYLGNAAVAASAIAFIAIAIVSANAAANRLPELAPVGSWEWSNLDERNEANILASGSQVALSMDDHVRFLDFTDPTRPRQVADVATPLWQSLPDRLGRAVMEGGTLYRVGQKKQLPVDDLEIAIVRPSGPSDAISLGPVRSGDIVSAPVPVPPFVFVAISRERSSSLRAFDITSKREMASLVIDKVADSRLQPSPGQVPITMPVQLVRHGAYLYIGSLHYLTTLDISDPSHPVIISQLRPHGKTERVYGIQQPLAWQENRLIEFRAWGETMTSYDLQDPAHPVEEDDYFCRGCTPAVDGSRRALYRPWQGGVMEFGVGRGGPHAERYLPAYRVVSSFVASGDFVYVLTAFDMNQHRKVQAFNVAK